MLFSQIPFPNSFWSPQKSGLIRIWSNMFLGYLPFCFQYCITFWTAFYSRKLDFYIFKFLVENGLSVTVSKNLSSYFSYFMSIWLISDIDLLWLFSDIFLDYFRMTKICVTFLHDIFATWNFLRNFFIIFKFCYWV